MNGKLALRIDPSDAGQRAVARRIGMHASASLRAELSLYPKPGLVSGRDAGAHRDMNAVTFLRSIATLRDYFVDVTAAGMRDAALAELRALGVAAERRMLLATRGVNTHRGAIFALGLLAAAVGSLRTRALPPSDAGIRAHVGLWRRHFIVVSAVGPTPSHGSQVAARYGASGARGEAANGFPAVFEIALPALRGALARGADVERAQLHALFHLLARLGDTNVLHRAGEDGLALVRDGASAFLAAGSVFDRGWLRRAETLHRRCCVARVSPGGSADMLAAAWFIHRVQTMPS